MRASARVSAGTKAPLARGTPRQLTQRGGEGGHPHKARIPVGTYEIFREKAHSNSLVEHVVPTDPQAASRLAEGATLRRAATWTLRLLSSTTVRGHTRAMSSSRSARQTPSANRGSRCRATSRADAIHPSQSNESVIDGKAQQLLEFDVAADQLRHQVGHVW